MAADWHNEIDAAQEAATRASSIILEHYSRLDAKSSAPADITTQTDRDAQEMILQSLSGRFPNDAFRAEEATITLGKLNQAGPRMWIIDPIDGTRGFVTKNGEFSVMIALVMDGIPVVGVVAEPAINVVTWATRGGGCWQSKLGETRRVHVTATTAMSSAVLIQSHSKTKQGPTQEAEQLKPLRVIETYSAGVKLARVADGTADLYVCDYMTMNDWDLAAGHILVTEAGGQVSNLKGEPRLYGRESPKQHGGLLATNARLHEEALRLIAAT